MSVITTLNDWITANSFRTQTNTNFTNLNTDKQETSWKDASGGYAWLTLFKINFKNVANTFTSFFTNTNTSSRTYTFQDRDGTIADNTDLALKWDKSGNLSQFASTTSAQLAWVISDETGSGSLVFANSPTLVTPALGTPSSGNSSNMTADWTNQIGYRNIPQNSQSAAYTTVLADGWKHIYHPSADTTARTFTIDSNANVAYPIWTAITFINDTSAGTITISINSDTLVLAGAWTTGSRTLAANWTATAIKVTSTRWQISGVNLT